MVQNHDVIFIYLDPWRTPYLGKKPRFCHFTMKRGKYLPLILQPNEKEWLIRDSRNERERPNSDPPIRTERVN